MEKTKALGLLALLVGLGVMISNPQNPAQVVDLAPEILDVTYRPRGV